jgi:tetratricopeptide (TPR) repeat protein
MSPSDPQQSQPDVASNSEQKLAALLSQFLINTPEGRKLVSDYRRNPSRYAGALNQYVRQRLAEDHTLAENAISVLSERDGQITNVVSESQIDQLISIAKLDELTIETTKLLLFFRDIKQLVVFVLLVSAIALATAGGIVYYRWWAAQPEPGPADTFNIAIAQFGEVTADGIQATERTRRFMILLCHYLDSETDLNNFGLEVHVDHKKMPVITEDAEAEKLAQQVDADLVVYGNVTIVGDRGEFMPRFYVSGRKSDIEVSGYNQLARPISFRTGDASEEELNRTLRTRAAILVNYVKGLVYLNVEKRNVEGAAYSFRQAVREAEKEQEPFVGQEVLYLMLSYAEKISGNYAEAQVNVEKALALNPNYARAFIGLGNIHYEQFLAGDNDPVLLDQAWDEYQMAMDATDRHANAYIDAKAMLGFGNIMTLRVRLGQGFDLLDRAVEYYLFVVHRHEQQPKDEGLARLAAYAYRNLGWVYDAQGDFVMAKMAYQRCMELPTDFYMHEKCQAEIDAIDALP